MGRASKLARAISLITALLAVNGCKGAPVLEPGPVFNPGPPNAPSGSSVAEGRFTFQLPALHTWTTAIEGGTQRLEPPQLPAQCGVFLAGFAPAAGQVGWDADLVPGNGTVWELPFRFEGLSPGSYTASMFHYDSPDWGLHFWDHIGNTSEFRIPSDGSSVEGIVVENSVMSPGDAVIEGRILLSGNIRTDLWLNLENAPGSDQTSLTGLTWNPKIPPGTNGRLFFRLDDLAPGSLRLAGDGSTWLPRSCQLYVNGSPSPNGAITLEDGAVVSADLHVTQTPLDFSYDWENWRGLNGFINLAVQVDALSPWTDDIILAARPIGNLDSAPAQWFLLPSELDATGRARVSLGLLEAGAYIVDARRLGPRNSDPIEVVGQTGPIVLELPPPGQPPQSLFEYPPLPTASADLSIQL